MSNTKTIILGISGSIAAVKAPELVRSFKASRCDVFCVMTKEAAQFVTPLSLSVLSGHPVLIDPFGSDAGQMPHLVLAKKAAILVVAPATASLMARFVTGEAEDLITQVYLSTTAPTLLAPAMHDTMWEHAATKSNVQTLSSRGVHFIGPIKGLLADGATSIGRMSEVDDIVTKAISLS